MSKPPIGRPFAKGMSGNPGGRPKIERHLRELLGDDLDGIAKCQAQIAQGKIPDGTKIESVSAREATRAAEWVYDRIYGKPKQDIKIGSDDLNVGPPISLDALSEEQLRVLAALDAALGGTLAVGDGDGGTEH